VTGARSASQAESQPAISSVGVLRWQDERDAAEVLACAFLDDPLVMAICSAPDMERQRRIWWSFRVAVRGHSLSGQPAWTITGATGKVVGVVLVTRPRPLMHPRRSDALFALRGFMHLGARSVLRGIKAARTIALQAPSPPFTYLRTLGVHPAFQGSGLGSRLVEQVIRTASAALPLYLETAKEQNLTFYARHGFERVGDFRCLGIRVWRLLRPAGAEMGRRT